MQIDCKSQEILKLQVREFLSKQENIREDTKDDILQTLDLEGGFLLWIKEKLGTKINLQDQDKLKKKIDKIENFEMLREGYKKHLRVKRILKKYGVENDLYKYVKNRIDDKKSTQEVIRRLKHFSSDKEFLNTLINHHNAWDIELFNFLDQFDDINKNWFLEIIDIAGRWTNLLKIKVFTDKFGIKTQKELNNFLEKWCNEYQGRKCKISEISIKELANRIIFLKKIGISKMDQIMNVLDNNIEKIETMMKYNNTKDKEMLYSNIIALSSISLEKINEFLDKKPDNHYENNWDYTLWEVNMFWWDWDNQKLMENELEWLEIDNEECDALLIGLWTDKRTTNRKNNLNFAKEQWIINTTKIYDRRKEMSDGSHNDEEYRNSNNMEISYLKLIDNKNLKEKIHILQINWVDVSLLSGRNGRHRKVFDFILVDKKWEITKLCIYDLKMSNLENIYMFLSCEIETFRLFLDLFKENKVKTEDQIIYFKKLEKITRHWILDNVKLFLDSTTGVDIKTKINVLHTWENLFRRNEILFEKIIDDIKNHKKWTLFGLFSVFIKYNFIELEGYYVNKDNFLDYMDDEDILLTLDKDSWLNHKWTKPRTKKRFLEDKERLKFLEPENMNTFRKFGTIIWQTILVWVKDTESIDDYYNSIFENMKLEWLSKSRNYILQLWEVFNLILWKEWYDIIDKLTESENNIGETFKKFIEKYSISDKWKTILTLMINAEINNSFVFTKKKWVGEIDKNDMSSFEYQSHKSIKEVLLNVFEKLKNYENIIERYDNVPIKTSIGIEYEVTKSIAAGYSKVTWNSYKNDIETISEYSWISKWSDAVHEIATNPSDNPYLILLETKLLEDLDFLDINFKKDDYEKGSRSLHISVWWEYWIEYDSNADFIQNILIASNLWWINVWEEVSKINSFSNIRSRWDDSEALFSEDVSPSTEYRSLSIDKAESFERLIISIFNLNMAKQVLDKYLIELNDFDLDMIELDDIDTFKKDCDDHIKGIENKDISTKEWELIYNYLRLKKDILNTIDDHNNNFIKNELLNLDKNIDKKTYLMLLDFLKFWNNTWSQSSVVLKEIFTDLEVLKSFSSVKTDSKEDFTKKLKNYWVDTEDLSITDSVYWYYKKRIEPNIKEIFKNNYITRNLDEYINWDYDDLVRKQSNLDRFNNDYKNTTEEDFVNSIKIDRDSIEEYITPELVNKFTKINNFFLKKDSINALSMLNTTIFNEEKTSIKEAAETTIFDKLDMWLKERKWYNEIQKSSNNMITKFIQKRILEFNGVVMNVISADDKKTIKHQDVKNKLLAA